MKRKKSPQGEPVPADEEQRPHPVGLMFFETADDALAAFLVVKGCRRIGLGTGEINEPLPVVTHIFDDAADQLNVLVSAYQYSDHDEVAAGRCIRMVAFLQRLRLDEMLRRYRQAESDLAKVRDPADELLS